MISITGISLSFCSFFLSLWVFDVLCCCCCCCCCCYRRRRKNTKKKRVRCFLCGARVHSCVCVCTCVSSSSGVFLLSVSVSCLSLSLVSSEKNFNNTHINSLLSLQKYIRNLSLFLLIHRTNTQHNTTLELSRAGAHFLPRIFFYQPSYITAGSFPRKSFSRARLHVGFFAFFFQKSSSFSLSRKLSIRTRRDARSCSLLRFAFSTSNYGSGNNRKASLSSRRAATSGILRRCKTAVTQGAVDSFTSLRDGSFRRTF